MQGSDARRSQIIVWATVLTFLVAAVQLAFDLGKHFGQRNRKEQPDLRVSDHDRRKSPAVPSSTTRTDHDEPLELPASPMVAGEKVVSLPTNEGASRLRERSKLEEFHEFDSVASSANRGTTIIERQHRGGDRAEKGWRDMRVPTEELRVPAKRTQAEVTSDTANSRLPIGSDRLAGERRPNSEVVPEGFGDATALSGSGSDFPSDGHELHPPIIDEVTVTSCESRRRWPNPRLIGRIQPPVLPDGMYSSMSGTVIETWVDVDQNGEVEAVSVTGEAVSDFVMHRIKDAVSQAHWLPAENACGEPVSGSMVVRFAF